MREQKLRAGGVEEGLFFSEIVGRKGGVESWPDGRVVVSAVVICCSLALAQSPVSSLLRSPYCFVLDELWP